MTARPPLVCFDAVERRHANGVLALQGLGLRLDAGEFVSLLGPSGCGKSTVLRLAAGLDAPSAGRVQRDTGHTGLVFQEPTLMPWASAWRNAALPLRLQGRPRAEHEAAARAALAAVGLADFADALPRELSGGMKMRVAIARALVDRPALLLLDEPFAALDEITRFRLNEDLLAWWSQRAFGALFVTHSVYEAVFLSQRILVMGPRPGRVLREVVVDAPCPRDAAFRATPHFAAWCVEVSQALQETGGG